MLRAAATAGQVDVQSLQTKFGIANHVEITTGKGGLPKVVLTHASGTKAEVRVLGSVSALELAVLCSSTLITLPWKCRCTSLEPLLPAGHSPLAMRWARQVQAAADESAPERLLHACRCCTCGQTPSLTSQRAFQAASHIAFPRSSLAAVLQHAAVLASL